MTCAISNRGTSGRGQCNGDKKHCCFHLELDYELNLGLIWNKDNTSMELLKVVSLTLELYFSFFLNFLKNKIHPMSPSSILHRSNVVLFFQPVQYLLLDLLVVKNVHVKCKRLLFHKNWFIAFTIEMQMREKKPIHAFGKGK